jgi:LCP family protein required for cell wall assembly
MIRMNSSNLNDSSWVDSTAPTQPVRTGDSLASFQPIRVQKGTRPNIFKRRSRSSCGCWAVLLAVLLLLAAFLFVPLLMPYNTRLLLMGVDRAPDGSFLGRTDTIMLIQANPLRPDVHILSIPRDLWVPIEGVGENRINTVHFFAEANQPGSGPRALQDNIAANFGISTPYYARVRFSGFEEVVNALGGVDITLEAPMAGLDAGRHHLDGAAALAFARDRKGTDDFFRMNQGQFILLAAARQTLNPLVWPRLPAATAAFFSVVDTNLPPWEWLRMGFALLRTGKEDIDARTITREMVTPFVTSGGAQVLGPNWDIIRPMVDEMFNH